MNILVEQSPCNLHDGELISFAINQNDENIKIEYKMEDSTVRIVNFYEVRYFRGVDLKMQNVVSRILQSSKNNFSISEIEKWIIWITSFVDSKSWINSNQQLELVKMCTEMMLDLVVIEPSSGVEIAVICKWIEIE